MRRNLHTLICGITFYLALFVTSCDVHEFPGETNRRLSFLLHLDYTTDMPLYKEIEYTRSSVDGDTKSQYGSHDLRYIINAYRHDASRSASRLPDTTIIFSTPHISTPDTTVSIELPEGNYTFRVWSDYVTRGGLSDTYYGTSDFADIHLLNRDPHRGGTPFRDAFRGTGDAILQPHGDNTLSINMQRPLGKFTFISTDMDNFLNRVVQMMKEKEQEQQEKNKEKASHDVSSIGDITLDSKAAYEELLQRIDLSSFIVLFRYNYYMPSAYNMFTDNGSDTWQGVTFKSIMQPTDEYEMQLGFDHVFAGDNGTVMSISVEVYNSDGELMSSSFPIDVPIVRNKETIVKGAFLSHEATGGVCINPGYDKDDYNVEIKW